MWNGQLRWTSPLADRRELGQTLLLFAVCRHASRPPRPVHHPDTGSPHPTLSLARWICLWRWGTMSCHIRWWHACQVVAGIGVLCRRMWRWCLALCHPVVPSVHWTTFLPDITSRPRAQTRQCRHSVRGWCPSHIWHPRWRTRSLLCLHCRLENQLSSCLLQWRLTVHSPV